MPLSKDLPWNRIKVHLRIRPTSKPSLAFHIKDETTTVLIDVQKHSRRGLPKTFMDQMTFSMDSIIQTTNQQTMYELSARASVKEFLNGYNATIMAYGQIGAGKTYTMAGDMKIYAHRGIIARSLRQIFEEKEAHPEFGTIVELSYIEIYQETIYDLLQQRNNDLMIIEENGLVDIRGLAKIRVDTEAHALKWFFEGEKQRCYGHHFINQISSRSHTIFTLYMERRVGRHKTEHDIIVAKLNLVDLAGVERLKKTNTNTGGQLRREACTINKSLSFLEQVVYAIKQGQAYIPFRQSKISILLKESLNGNCKTTLIVCAWPEEYFLDETIGALRFAQRVKTLRTFSVYNKKIDCCNINGRRHTQEIANLQQELALRDALHGQPGLAFDDLTKEVKNKFREKIQVFLQNDEDLERIPIDNKKQVKELFCLFKEAQISLRAEFDKVLHEYGLVSPINEPLREEHAVGELTIHGFHVGIAPPSARPNHPSSLSHNKQCGETMLKYKEEDPCDDVWESKNTLINDKFNEFKQTSKGREQKTMIKMKQMELKLKKRYAKDLCQTCNEMNQEIKKIKRILKENRDNEEFKFNIDNYKSNLYHRFNILKSNYHNTFNEVQLIKDIIDRLTIEIRDCKSSILKGFYFWFGAHDKYQIKTTDEYLEHLAEN